MKIFILCVVTFLLTTSPEAQQNSVHLKLEAERHLEAGKLGEAIDILNKYLTDNPDAAEGYNLRGSAYEQRREFEASVNDYTAALRLNPSNIAIQRNLSRAEGLLREHFLNYIEGYKREIAKYPAKAVNYLEIGKSYKAMRDWESAEVWYDEYLKREEGSADEILRYTEILAKNEKYRKGEPILKRYTKKYPEDHRLWSRYGYFNLWMGNRTESIKAFEESLKIRPYFREALDGLDQAKGKGDNYTYYPDQKRRQEYPIDKYFRQLKSDPGNNSIRLTLIKELINKDRLEEAYQQLKILSADSTSYSEFSSLWTEVNEKRKDSQSKRTTELLKKYNSTPEAETLLLQLAQNYRSIEIYDSSAVFYAKYLSKNPSDIQARFEYAEVLAWDLNYPESKKQLDLLLTLDPVNTQYKLLSALISIWMVEDLDLAGGYLLDVLSKESNNYEALLGMASLSILKKDFAAAADYLFMAGKADPGNERTAKLESDLDFHKLREEEERVFQILERGRVMALENNCSAALELYEEYLALTDPGRMILKEYADVNACAGNFSEAIGIYNDLISAEYDSDIDIERAKVYYWSGDSLSALKDFSRLYALYPDNFEIRLYLGDSYTKMKMYADARIIYNGLLNEGLSTAQKDLINLRIGWLPLPGTESAFGAFPNYLMASPYALYYGDNLKFNYNLQGIRLDIGLIPFLTLAPEAATGFISSENSRKNFNSAKGNLLFRITEQLTAGAGAGIIMFSDYKDKSISEAFIKYESPEIFSTALTFNRQDAAQILYSSELVDLRLDADLWRLNGWYRFNSGIKLSAVLTYTRVSDKNKGGFIDIEAGRYFTERLLISYEYFRTTFDRVTPLYFSPGSYNSHSLLTEYDFIKQKINKLTAGVKAGIIANSDYILREVFVQGMYGLFRNLTLQSRLGYGSSLQNQLGYSSFSAQLALYWML